MTRQRALRLLLLLLGLAACGRAGIPAALAQDEALDPSFGTGGRVSTVVDGTLGAYALAVDAQTRLVTAGAYRPSSEAPDHWALARYLANGQPDTGFDGDGLRVQDTYRCNNDVCTLAGPARAVLPEGNGLVLAAGDDGNVVVVARFTAAGAPDATFGDGGFWDGEYLSDRTTTARGLAPGPNGSVHVLVEGRSRSNPTDARMALVRLTSAGVPDDGFGDFGYHYEAFAPFEPRALVRQSSGRLLVAGYHDYGDSGGSSARCVVARYWANGAARDDSFGENGLAEFHFDQDGMFDTCLGLALDSAGRVLVVGTSNERLALARLTADGNLDPAFSGDGKLVLAPGFPMDSYAGVGVAVDGAGRVLLAGSHFTGLGTSRFLAGRLTPEGLLDSTFGSGGLVFTSFPGALHNQVEALALQADGRFVAAGQHSASGGSPRQALVRYLNEVAVPTGTATGTATPTSTDTATATSTETATATATRTATDMATVTATGTATATATRTGTDSPTATSTASPTPTAALTVRGRVVLERRRTDAGAEVCAGGRCVTTGADGSYILGTVPGARLTVRHPSYLAAERTLPATTGELVLPLLALVAGDLNQDGKVEVDDAAMIGQRFDLRFDPLRPGPPWLAACDITDDGLIDIRDMVAVQFNLRKVAPSPWP